MFNNNCKLKQLTKEEVKMKNILRCMVFVVVAFCATNVWAATRTVPVSATIPAVTGGLTVGISKITGTGVTALWTKNQTSISFGTLVWDSALHMFKPASYYAIDIGVTDNSVGGWILTHTRALGQGTNLNNKVNVSFIGDRSSWC